jgi:hypothetical protein
VNDLQSFLNSIPEGSPRKQQKATLRAGTWAGDGQLRKAYVTLEWEFGAMLRGGTDGLRIMPSARGTRLERPVITGVERYGVFVGADGFEMDRGRVYDIGKTCLLKARAVSDLWLKRSVFNGARQEHGVYWSEGGYHLILEDCLCDGNERFGCQVNACPYTAQGVLISHNEFHRNRSGAAQFSGVWGGVVEFNNLSQNARDFVIFRDLRKPQCSNADLDFTNQYGKFQWHDDRAQDIYLGPGMVKV